MIECKNIHFSYGSNREKIFSELNFCIETGQFVTFMGCSGCGKTTLLNIMNGLLSPYKGQITNLAKSSVTLFQDTRLIPWMTISNNVKFGAREKNILISDEDVNEMLQSVGIPTHIKDAYPKILSGGMEQRVAFARALACQPDMLFMDEPFSALDMITRKDLAYRVACYVQEKKATAIFVTHDVTEACFLSDILYEMRGVPAKIKKLTSISKPTLQRNETMIQTIVNTVMHKKRQKNSVEFERMATCKMGENLEKFIQFMEARMWRIIHVRQKRCPSIKKIPDCIVIDGKHPDAQKLIRIYEKEHTRFLYLNTTPKDIKASRIPCEFDAIKNWWGWENLYADLIEGATKSRVRHITIGHNWSYVETDKGAGLGRTPCRGTEGARTIANAGSLEGKTVRDLAQGLLSDDDLLRSLAIAAIQCVYNTADKGRTGESQWGFSLFKHSVGKKACIGYCPCSQHIIPDMKIIEREPKEGHYTVEEGETLLRSVDSLVVTAQTLMNGSLPRILFLAQGADIMLYGPTCPLSSVWDKYGIRYACGVRVTNKTAMRQFVSQAGTMLMQDKMAEKITMEF